MVLPLMAIRAQFNEKLRYPQIAMAQGIMKNVCPIIGIRFLYSSDKQQITDNGVTELSRGRRGSRAAAAAKAAIPFVCAQPLQSELCTAAHTQTALRFLAGLHLLERKTGFGPATSTLARLRSTN